MLFTSRERDDESDLMYYRARHYSPRLGHFVQKDPSRVRANGRTTLYLYATNNPVTRIDPYGEEDLTPGAYVAVENAGGSSTLLLLASVEGQAEAWGEKLKPLGVQEGFENLWSERGEMRETMRTAEGDDIVVLMGHTYKRGGEEGQPEEKGFEAASDYIPLYEVFGSTRYYSTTRMIRDLNQTPGGPALLFLNGCQSADFAEEIARSTQAKLVLATDRPVGAFGEAPWFVGELSKEMAPDKSMAEVVYTVNSRAEGNDPLLILVGDEKYKAMPIRDLLFRGDYPARALDGGSQDK